MQTEEDVTKAVEAIFEKYDTDKSGTLDKKECKKFVEEKLVEMLGSDKYDESQFESIFQAFDTDGSGSIDKAELTVFMKMYAGI